METIGTIGTMGRDGFTTATNAAEHRCRLPPSPPPLPPPPSLPLSPPTATAVTAADHRCQSPIPDQLTPSQMTIGNRRRHEAGLSIEPGAVPTSGNRRIPHIAAVMPDPHPDKHFLSIKMQTISSSPCQKILGGENALHLELPFCGQSPLNQYITLQNLFLGVHLKSPPRILNSDRPATEASPRPFSHNKKS